MNYFIKRYKSRLKKILKVNFFVIAITLGYLFTITPIYTSSSSLYLITSNQSSNPLASLTGAFGKDSLDSIVFFDLRDVVKSRMLKEKIVEKSWLDKNNQETNLINLWGMNEQSFIANILGRSQDKLKIQNRAIKKLDKRIITNYNLRTGLFELDVMIEDPKIAQQIANEINSIIIEYSNEVNQLKAIEELSFLNQKFLDIKKELHNAEDKLKFFVEENKNLSSPNLQIEKNRLERDIEFAEQSYRLILNEKELAEIKSQKVDFMVTNLDNANFPLKPSYPDFKITLFVIFLLTSMICICFFFYDELKIVISD